MKKVHLCEELTFVDGESYLTLKQTFFRDVDIDTCEGENIWVAWVEDDLETNDDVIFYKPLTGRHDTSEECFKSVIKYYDDIKETPKGLKNKTIKIFNYSLELESEKVDACFNKRYKNSLNLNELLKVFKESNIDFDILLDYHSEYGENHVDYDFTDYDLIENEMVHISDRWRCFHRVAFLKEFCTYDSFNK